VENCFASPNSRATGNFGEISGEDGGSTPIARGVWNEAIEQPRLDFSKWLALEE